MVLLKYQNFCKTAFDHHFVEMWRRPTASAMTVRREKYRAAGKDHPIKMA
jgi:hypothetical protein